MQTKLKELLHMALNIQHIYDEIVLAELNSNTNTKRSCCEKLEMALEVEEKIYQSLSWEEIDILANRFFKIKNINIISETNEINPIDKPLYRVYLHLENLITQKESVFSDSEMRENEEIDYNKINDEIKQNALFFNLRFALIFLNLHRRKKGTSIQEYYNIIYFNPNLESILLKIKFSSIHLDEIDDFLSVNLVSEINPEYEEEYGLIFYEKLISDFEKILNGEKKSYTISEYLYYATIYLILSNEQKENLLDDLDAILKSPKITLDVHQKITYFLALLCKIEKKEEQSRKKKNIKKCYEE